MVIVVGRRTLEPPLHHSQQYVVRWDEIARQRMRKRVVGSEVQLEERIFLWCVSPECPLYGRLAAEGVDRFADGLGTDVSGILYGVEVGGWELTRRCTFLISCIGRILHFKVF